MLKFREIYWAHSKKTPRQMSGGKDGQNIFHRILPATVRGLTSKTAVNWHLKVKDIEHNVGLTKNYCITVSMQKVSLIHKLIQQILGLMKKMVTPNFDHIQPKIIEITFSFPEFAPARKKSVHSINSWDTQSVLESCDQAGHTQLWPCPTPNFLINF